MDETREAAKEFGETLRAKLAASREGLRLEELRGRDEPTTDTGAKDEPQDAR